MKKTLVMPLIVALALLLLAGCVSRTVEMPEYPVDFSSGEQKIAAEKSLLEDEPASAGEYSDLAEDIITSPDTDWPADKLPLGMPQYPDGKMLVSVMGGSVLINISGTTTSSINDYLAALQTAGWESKQGSAALYVATNGDWRVQISFGEDNLTIMVVQNG